MKIIFFKSNIKILLLFFLATHCLFGQETIDPLEKKIEASSEYDATFENENTDLPLSRQGNLVPPSIITGNLSICLPGPNTTQLTGFGIPNPVTPWTSSNPLVATISNTGLVTAVTFGATTINYYDNIGNTVSATLYVSTFPTISSPSGTYTTCAAGTIQLSGSVFPNVATPWESTNTAIATVNNTGLVTGVSGGVVNILYRNLGGCTVLQPVTINPLLSPTITCGVSTYNQVTFNWGAVAGASTYTVVYTVNGGAFQFGASGNILTYTRAGLLPGDYVDVYVTPSGPVGSCFTLGTIRCFTLTCTPATTPAAPTLTPTHPSCTVATGSITITGVAGETYSFDGGAYAATLVYSGLAASSSHTVTAKNAFGCISAISNITLNAQPPTPGTPTLTPTQPTCTVATGSVTITAVAGETYSFDGGAYSGTLIYSGLPAGSSHTVTARNASGCISAIANITLNAQPPTPAAPTLTPTQPTCTLATGSVTITAGAGETYSFDSGVYSGTLIYSGLAASSSHTATAQNAAGCISAIANITLNAQPPTPSAPTLTPTHPTCTLATGSVTITAVAGETYSFDGGVYLGTLVYSGLLAGSSHTATAQNASGCISAIANITLNAQPPTPVAPTLTPTQPTCTVATGCVTITAVAGETYSFDGGAYSGTLIYCGLAAGSSHTVTARNAAGCISAISNITLNTQPPTPAAPTVTPTHPTCTLATGSVTITAVAGETYSFDGSVYSGTLVYSGLVAGSSHSATAQNAAGCISTTANITLNAQPPTPSAPTLTPTQPTCTVATGSVTITAVAGETYSFDGSVYSGTLVYSGLVAGSSHTVTAQNAAGCISAISNITLNTQPLTPATPILTPTQPTCTVATGCVTITAVAGETYSFDGGPYSGTLIYCGLPAGSSHTVTARNAAGCISAIANITLNTQPPTPASPTLTPTQPTCTVATGSVTITSVVGETYSFDGSVYTGTLTYSGLAAGSSHTVTAQNASGCISAVANITLITQPISPATPTVAVTQPSCSLATGTITITAVVGETYSFDGSPFSGTLIYSGLAASSSHTVTARNAGGCNSPILNVSLNAQPPSPTAPVSTGNITQCEVSPIQTLDANNAITPIVGITLTWYDAATLGNIVANPTLNSVGTVTYYAEANDGTCPSLTRTAVTLTIDPAPTAPVSTGNITQCEASPIQTLDANNAITPIVGITLTWYDAATLGNIVASPTLNTVGTVTYYAEANDGTCPSLTRTAVTLTIDPAPVAPISTGNISACELSPIQTLDANNAIMPIVGITLTWYDAATLGNIVANPTLNTVGTVTYYAEANDGTCPSLTRTAVTLTIDPAPTAPISTGNITQCEASPIQTLDANNAIAPIVGITLTWYDAATLGNIVASPTLNTVGTVTYYAEANDGTCPSYSRTAVTLTIDPAPTAPISTGNITACELSPIQTLNANDAIVPISGINITWYDAATLGSIVVNPTLNTVGTITYYAEGDDGTCPSLTRTAVTLTIDPAPTAPISTGNITQCEASPIQTLDANNAITPIVGITLTWYDAPTLGNIVANPTLNTVGTVTYYVEANDGTCPSYSRTAVTLTINPAPLAAISTGNITACELSPIQTLDANNAITPIVGITLTWYDAPTLGNIVANPILNTVGTITYYAEANDGTCPSLTRTAVTLTINPAPAAPTSTGNITQCEVSPIQTLDANNAITPIVGITLTWYDAPILGNVVTNPTLNSVGTVTYYAEANDGTCPSLTRTAVTLTIDPATTAPISTGNITQCEASPIQTLDANNAIAPIVGITLTWYDAATLGNIVANPTLNTVGTITYYAEANDGTCPSLTRTAVTLTIDPAPVAPISTGNITACELSPIQTLDANNAITPIVGITLTWYDAATLGNIVANPTLNTVGTVTYYAEANDGTCPSLTRTAVTLTIDPAPTAPISTGNITQCEASPIQTLDANNAIAPIVGITLTWYDAATLGNIVASPTLNTVGTVTYYAEANDGTCPSYSRTAVTLTIDPAPTAPISTGNITACELSPIQTLNANDAIVPISGINITWYDAATLGSIVVNPTLNTVGTITYYAEGDDGTCPSLTRTAVTLTIDPAPTAPISTGNITQCEASPIQTLDANNAITPIVGITLSWYDAPILGNIVANPTLNTVGTITYYAEANDGSCPSYSRTAVTLTINPAPTAPISTGNITQCELSPIQTLDANNAITPIVGITLTWYDAPTLGNIVANPILNAVGTITYYAEANDGTCPSLTRTAVTLTINPAPTAPTSTGNITQCEVSPIQTLDANNAITPILGIILTWYDAPILGNVVANPTLNSVGTVTYYAEANDGTCPSYTRTAVTLRINPAPIAPASNGNIIQCERLPIQTLNAVSAITPIPGQNVNWYTAATLGTVVAIPTLNTTGTITYYGESNNGTCPSYSRTAVTLTINPAPTAPISTGNITACELSPIQTLNANNAITPITGITLTWYNAPTLGSIVANPTLNTVGTVTYYVQANDGTCPSLTRTAVTLTINPAPLAPVSTGNITQCEALPIQTLNANNAIAPIVGITLTWYDAPTLGNIVATPTLNTVGTVTYYAEANDGTCPSYSRTAVTLTINPAPTAPIATGNITQCEWSPIQTLNANNAIPPITGITLTWYDAPTLGNIIANPTLNTVGTVTYYAEANDGTCPSLTRTAVTLTINPAPTAPISTGNITECELSPIQTLNANNAITPITGITITWYDAATLGNVVANPTLNAVGTITYYAEANDGTCPSYSRTAVTLTINPAPTAPISTGNITACEASPIQTLDANNAITPITGITTTWYDAPTLGNIVANPTLNAVGTITYYAEANDGACPSYSRTAVTLIILPAPAAPISTGNITQCEVSPLQTINANTAITPITGITVTWFDAPTLGNIVANPTLNAIGTITYYAEARDGTCLSLTRTAVTLTINPAPAAPISNGDIFQCEQSPLQTITALATAVLPTHTITWYDAPTAGSVVTNPSINTAISKIYYAQSNDGTCNSLTRTPVILTISPLPVVPTIGAITQPDCTTATGSVTIFPVQAGVLYSLDGGPFTNTAFYNLLTAGTTHTLIAKNTGGCLSAVANFNIIPQPATPNAPTLIPTQPTCTLATGSISINGVAGETYSFDNGPYLSTLVYSGLIASSTHTVKAKNTAGCISSIVSLTLDVQPLTPSPPTLTPIQPTCTEATGSVLISNVIGETYSLDGGPFSANLIYANLPSGSTHDVTAKNGSGCVSAPTFITLGTQPPTPATPSFFLQQPDCTVAVGELTILNVAGETYSYDGSAYSNTLIYNNIAPGTYTLTAQNTFGCISPIASVIVNPQPITATPEIIDGVICVDQATGVPFKTHLLNTRIDAATHTFVWTLDGIGTSDSGSSVITTEPGVYTVVATNIATGCPSLTATAVVTESFPALGITTQVLGQFTNDTTIVTTVSTGTGPFLYQLDYGTLQQSNIFTSVSPGTHTITVRDENGCTYLTTEVIVLGYMNFFTPNGDNYNDTWNIIGLKDQPSARIYIFDRHGKLVKQLNPTTDGWDGTMNNQIMPATDYWFRVEYTEGKQSKEFKSHFSLVR